MPESWKSRKLAPLPRSEFGFSDLTKHVPANRRIPESFCSIRRGRPNRAHLGHLYGPDCPETIRTNANNARFEGKVAMIDRWRSTKIFCPLEARNPSAKAVRSFINPSRRSPNAYAAIFVCLCSRFRARRYRHYCEISNAT